MASNIESLFALLWTLVSIHRCSCVSVNCNLGQPVEIRPYEIICTGINPSSLVEWRRSFQMGAGDGVIASCQDVNICTEIDRTRHRASRATGNTSSLTILSVTRDDDTLGTWTCSSGGQSPSCTLPPVIYLPELSAPCTAELRLDGPVARCSVQKAYPVPECTWFESITPSGGSGEAPSNSTIPSTSDEAQTESVSAFYESSRLYFSATCVLKRNVTNIEGNYSYTVVISPGSASHSVQFVGPSSVVSPSSPTLRNCSHGYIPPSQEFLCTCEVTDLGWPRGHVMWIDHWGRLIRTGGQSNSVQLLRRDVLETSVNRTYTCEVRSTDNFAHTVDYVPLFAFGPIDVRIYGPISFDGDDLRNVTLTCTAFEVNPRPNFTWQGQGQEFQTSAGNGGDERLIYTESISFSPTRNKTRLEVTCFVRNPAFSGPYVHNASFAVICSRNCAPSDSGGSSGGQDKGPQSSPSTMEILVWALGAVCAFLLIVLIVVLIVVVTRRRALRKRQNKKEMPQLSGIINPNGGTGRNLTQHFTSEDGVTGRGRLHLPDSCPPSPPPPPPFRARDYKPSPVRSQNPPPDTTQNRPNRPSISCTTGENEYETAREQSPSPALNTTDSNLPPSTSGSLRGVKAVPEEIVSEQSPSSASNAVDSNLPLTPSGPGRGVTAVPAEDFKDSSMGSDSSAQQTLPKH